MGTGIQGPPNTYDFGYEFNYALWIPGTSIDMVNVPWDNNYRDVVRFANKAALNTYIDSIGPSGITINQLSYVKPGEPVRVDVPHTRALKYNYLRATNPLQPIPGDEQKAYYYFILDAKYIAPNTTELILQLDVFQTYGYDVQFGNCYVERGHIGIANTNAFNNNGRDYLTVPEGFDLGGEYRVIAVRNKWIMSPTPFDLGASSRYPSYDVLVFSTVDLLADPGPVTAPNLVSADGSEFQGTIHGASVYVFDAQSFLAYLSSMKTKPWVTQGIVSITLIPKINRYHPGYVYGSFPLPSEAPPLAPRNIEHELYIDWRNHSEYVNHIDERYRHLTKLKTYPYTAIEMTTFHGTPLLLKPESWNSPNAHIMERVSLVPPAQRVEFMPRGYNADNINPLEKVWPPPVDSGSYLAGVVGDDWGDYLDMVTSIANFPTMAIVNNGAISYLAANTHAIAYQHQSADWSQSRALASNQVSYDQQTGAMHTAMSLAGSGVNADIANTANLNRTQAAQAIANGIAGLAGAGGNAAMGGLMGGPAGAAIGGVGGIAGSVASAVNTGIGIAANDEGLAIRSRLSAEQVMANNQQSQLVRDTNKDLSDWAARGDYANTISGINAKVQDAALIQPTTSGQIGGETINMINGGLQVNLRWKMIDKSAMRVVGEFWLRYGYAIRAFIRMPANLMVMTRFTYWKLSETYIIASEIPEGHKQTLRGVFEKGVTVWANPNDIGQIDYADNEPLEGISY